MTELYAHDVVFSAVRQNYGNIEQEVDMLQRMRRVEYALVGRLKRRKSTEWGPWRFAASPSGLFRSYDGRSWENLAQAKRDLTPRRK